MKKAKMVDIEVVIDSTGIKNRNDGEYRATKYGKRKEWCKIHIAVDSKTKRILNIIITDSSKEMQKSSFLC